jgi:hypothetical protein
MTAIAERAREQISLPERRKRPFVAVTLFVAVSLLGATLLFAVQPMVAKMLLPSYGGSPMVWNTSMLFFQAALLAGYAYAHWSQRRFGAGSQPLVQMVLVALPLLLLPIDLPTWSAASESVPPALWLLVVLSVMAGAPFVVLATTSPLIQRWYSWSGLPRAHDPYFLFAASNTGSFVALLAYPLLLEPIADVNTQARWWAIGYGAFAALMIVCALTVRFTGHRLAGAAPADAATTAPAGTPAEVKEEPEPGAAEPEGETGDEKAGNGEEAGNSEQAGTEAADERKEVAQVGGGDEITWSRRARWLFLAFLPSSLMLGVTTHISTDVAPVPLMWVVPLAIYLVTFVVAFAGLGPRWRTPMIYLAGGLAVVMPWIAGLSKLFPAGLGLPLDLVLLVVAGLAGHGLLAADRPSPAKLTEFYLLVSAGGALGGLFNGLMAPVIFDWVIEFPLVTAMLGVLPWMLGGTNAIAQRLGRARQWVSAAVLLSGLGFVAGGMYMSSTWGWAPLVIVLVLWAWGIALVGKPVFVAGAAAATVVALLAYQTSTAGVRERTFFGSYEVKTSAQRKSLVHGTTLHGFQMRDQPRIATSYYAASGPLGDVFTGYADGSTPVGVVGLGAGTIAAYGQPGQRLDFYEIDPEVVRIARNPQYFTYLRDCKCQARTIVGDGRLRLAAVPNGTYGVIVLDAFSSDSVPTHLLTKEAISGYMSKLRPGGVLAFHVSNRHLDLAAMLGATARSNGLVARSRLYEPNSDRYALATHWVVIGRNDGELQRLGVRGGNWTPIRPGGPVWTDTYSSLFGILDLG